MPGILRSEGQAASLKFSHTSSVVRDVLTTRATSRAMLPDSTQPSGHVVVLRALPLRHITLALLTGGLCSVGSGEVLLFLLRGPRQSFCVFPQRSSSTLNTWVPVNWKVPCPAAAVRTRVGLSLPNPKTVSEPKGRVPAFGNKASLLFLHNVGFFGLKKEAVEEPRPLSFF